MTRGIGSALLVLATLQGAPALAQNANGNVYNGTAHEPPPSAGNAGMSAQQAQQQNATVEQLDKQVLKRAETPTGTAAGCTANQKACPP